MSPMALFIHGDLNVQAGVLVLDLAQGLGPGLLTS